METLKDFTFFSGRKPRVFGHRGAAGVVPENTLASVERAFKDGGDYIEVDVRPSKEGAIVIVHDATLERTTDGQGEVRERTLKDLKGLDAGYWFTLDGGGTYPFRGQGLQITTLEELLAAFPKIRLTVEIKQTVPGFVARVLDTVEKGARVGAVLIAAEEDAVIQEVRREMVARNLPLATGFSYGEVSSFMRWVWTGQAFPFEPPGQALQIPPVYQGRELVTEQSVAGAHKLGLEVHVWTINEISEMERLLGLGVDGLVTDYPARLRECVSRIGKNIDHV